MREALVILPQFDNNGSSLDDILQEVIVRLGECFSGCTVREATGYWTNGGKVFHEPVWECVSAYQPGMEGDNKLRSVAEFIGEKAEQLAVYLRYASGQVEILDTSLVAQAAA